MSRVRITRLKIRNYKGVEEFDYDVPAEGAIFAGKNGGGKTSLLDSIRAALGGQGIDASAIRLGATASEILVNLDDISVRRTITHRGSTITVEDAGVLVKSPVAWLKQLLGTSALDPIELFVEKDKKKRKAIILAALPCSITEEHLVGWLGDRYIDLPAPIRTKALTMNGLEAVSMVREHFFDARKAANVAVKAAHAELHALQIEADALAPPEPPKAQGVLSLVGGKATKAKTAPVSPEGAEAALNAALVAQSQAVTSARAMDAQATAAAVQESKTAATRDDIAAKRSQAAASRASAEGMTGRAVDACEDVVADLKAKLAEAERVLDSARVSRDTYSRFLVDAAQLEASAKSLEDALAVSAIVAPEAVEMMKAAADEAAAARAVEQAQRGVSAAAVHARVEGKREETKTLETDAAELTKVVDTLSRDAPGQLIAESGGIAGLDVTGDDIKLDGVALDSLSGREQLVFAVDIAKRANGKAKLLIVDGGERLDPEQSRHFVESCVKDGYQLLMTKVAAGEVVVEALTNAEAAS